MLDELLAPPRKVAPSLRNLSPEALRDAIARGDAKIQVGLVVPRFLGGSVAASDLVFYLATNGTGSPTAGYTDSTSLAGGGIDVTRRPDFTQMGANDTVRVVSDTAGDNARTLTITGRLADGSLASETLSLNGTTPVTSSNTYERLLKAEMSATHATAIATVARTTGPTTIRVIPAGEKGFLAMFQQLASSTSGATSWYEKIFVKNTNGSLALTSATVTINADPNAVFTFWLAASLNDSATITNRTTAPGGSSFTTGPQNVANSQSLSSGSAQGIWMKLALLINNAALKSTVTMEIDGQTT